MFSLSFFTLSPDLYEILDSVRSDPYIQFYFFGPNKKMRVKMPNLRRNITISNGEVFFSTPFIKPINSSKQPTSNSQQPMVHSQQAAYK